MKYHKSAAYSWFIPGIVLCIVMSFTFMALYLGMSESQDVRSRAAEPDDTREIPNFTIPHPSGVISGTPDPVPSVSGYVRTTGVIVGTGVPGWSRGPLQTPRPTPSISPTIRPFPPCNIVLTFMRRPCIPPVVD